MNSINLRLKELRRQRNMSQEAMAHALGVSRQAIIAIEQGASLPSLPVIMAMLRVLDVPFTDLFHNAWSPLRAIDQPEDLPDDHRVSLYCRQTQATMPITLAEDKGAFHLTAELAGVKEEDLMVDLGQQHVLISAIRKPRWQTETMVIHTNELPDGPLLRIVSLPSPIDAESASAEYIRGILYLTLPKQVPTAKRRITFNEKQSIIKENYGSE